MSFKLYFSVKPEYRKNGVWLMNDETALALRTLKDSAGNYLWRDSDDTILGKPVVMNSAMPSAAAGA
jgi:HK97 family phage major capsid protein